MTEVEQWRKEMMDIQVELMRMEVERKKQDKQYKALVDKMMDLRQKVSDKLYGKVE